jgi:hypothetical protein
VKAISHVRQHISDTKPIPKAGDAATTEVPRTRPQIFAFDPSATTLRPARITDTTRDANDIDLEANTHVEPADEVPADVRKLLSVPPWVPEFPFDIREFDASQQLAEALLAVDPSLKTNDNTRSAEAMYNRLVTLVAKGDLTFVGPQSTAPFLNVDPSGTVPTPRKHAAEANIDGTKIKVSLYSPRPEDSTTSIAIDRFEFSNDSMSSTESKSTTVAPSFTYSGPLTEDGNHRMGVNGLPLGGQTASKGGSGAVGSVRRNLWRTNAPTDGHRLRAVALVEVSGPKGTVWVTGDMVLRSIETPPDSANVEEPALPLDDQETPKTEESDTTNKSEDQDKGAEDDAEVKSDDEAEAKADAEAKTKADKAKSDADKAAEDKAEAAKVAAETEAAKLKAEAQAARDKADTQAKAEAEAKTKTKSKDKLESFLSGLLGGPPPKVGRSRGERRAVVDGVRAPKGYLWESMPPDGDCFFHALERIIYREPYDSAAELDQRIRRLRIITADELSGPRRNEYFEAFQNIRIAAENRGRKLTAEQLRAPISPQDSARHLAEFNRQVEQIRQRGIWRTDAFHLVPRAAAAALARRGAIVRVYSRQLPNGATFGENTAASAHGAALIAHNHYHLAVPTTDHTPADTLGTPEDTRPTRPWKEFADLLGPDAEQYTPGQPSPDPTRITVFGDEDTAHYIWYPPTGTWSGEMRDANSQPVHITFDQALDDPTITVARASASIVENTTPDLPSTDPDLDAAIAASLAEFETPAAPVQDTETDPELDAATAESSSTAHDAPAEDEQSSDKLPTLTDPAAQTLDLGAFDKKISGPTDTTTILPPESPTGTVIDNPLSDEESIHSTEDDEPLSPKTSTPPDIPHLSTESTAQQHIP